VSRIVADDTRRFERLPKLKFTQCNNKPSINETTRTYSACNQRLTKIWPVSFSKTSHEWKNVKITRFLHCARDLLKTKAANEDSPKWARRLIYVYGTCMCNLSMHQITHYEFFAIFYFYFFYSNYLPYHSLKRAGSRRLTRPKSYGPKMVDS
jgi:hypothetical protein